ncbi:glycosyltransferase 61 family protein [Seohaeicola saemankumensis]|uniref:Glycosyltransferase 61 family protein n=1 Tax=Seohaeicola saemankumensis TaxID=481181 RepID=A0ABW3TDD9_9RHOB
MAIPSLLPVVSRAFQKFRRYKSLEDSAEKTVTVEPPETMRLPEALYLSDQLDDVTGTHGMAVSLADELEQTVAPNLRNIETRAYFIRNAVIGYNRISSWSGFKDLSLRYARSRPMRITEELDAAALCSSWQGNDYFAHFLVDDAATHALAQEFAKPIFSTMDTPRTSQCVEYLARFGFEYSEKNQVSVRELWFFQDFSLGPDKRRRLQKMAANVKAATLGSRPRPGAFIRRGVRGQVRCLDNAAEIEAWCISQGFVVIDPEYQSLDEICGALKDVPIVIGVEGSHLVHGLFSMAERGIIICIQPADRFNVIFRHLCAALNLQWGFVVAKGTVNGFHLELDKLKATLELFQKRTHSGLWI